MDKEYYKEFFSDIYKHILINCVKSKSCGVFNDKKGVIIEDDILSFAKNNLKYDELLRLGKVKEITIDASWDPCFVQSQSNDGKNVLKYWNKLVVAAYLANHGLLVINVSNMKVFEHCWHLKQLAKQEKELIIWPSLGIPFNNYSQNELLAFRNELNDIAGVKFTPEQLMDLITGFMFDGYVLIVLKNISWNDVVAYAQEKDPSEFAAMMNYYHPVIF